MLPAPIGPAVWPIGGLRSPDGIGKFRLGTEAFFPDWGAVRCASECFQDGMAGRVPFVYGAANSAASQVYILRAHWIDLGVVAPERQHAVYLDMTASCSDTSTAVVIWSRVRSPCLRVGVASPERSLIDFDTCARLGVSVISDPVGGGLRWIDVNQYSFRFILPARRDGSALASLRDAGNRLVIDVFRHFGVSIQLRDGNEFWTDGAKIADLVVGRVGRSVVCTGSFPISFPYARYVRALALPSDALRLWLLEALPSAVRAWQSVSTPPDGDVLKQIFRERVSVQLGWVLEDRQIESECDVSSTSNSSELAPMPPRADGIGIPLNAGSYLAERRFPEGWIRLLTSDGIIRRVAAENPALDTVLARCTGAEFDRRFLQRCLRRLLAADDAQNWAQRLVAMVPRSAPQRRSAIAGRHR